MPRTPVPHRLDVALALRRRPRHRRVLVLSLAVLCGFAVMTVVRKAEDASAAWGESVAVLVATEDLAAGDHLDAGNTQLDHQPAPLVPDGALVEVPADGRLAEPVYAGEVVREERLAADGLSALAARLPSGTRAMAIPVEPGLVPTLVVGDRVDVLVALGAESAGDGPPGFTLATAALVVDVDDAAVTVAVPADTATRLTVAFGAGAVRLALTGG